MKSFSIQEIHEIVGGKLIGSTDQIIDAPEEIRNASRSQITFIGSAKFKKYWSTTKACAVIVNSSIDLPVYSNKAIIQVKNADLAMALLLEAFLPESPKFKTNIHPTATVDKTASIGENCKIGAGCYIGKNVTLKDNVIIYPNVSIFDNTELGENSIVWSGTVIRERTKIGKNCILHANVSIGADGFGYRLKDDGSGLQKIAHIGNVMIGNDVEIGANSAIDRAKFSSTIIGDGCKIDNLVQIAHNCVIGQSCILAGQSALAGSVTLGNGVIIGGNSTVKDHVTIGDGVTIGGNSGVIHNISPGETVLGFPASNSKETLRQWVAIRNLIKS